MNNKGGQSKVVRYKVINKKIKSIAFLYIQTDRQYNGFLKIPLTVVTKKVQFLENLFKKYARSVLKSKYNLKNIFHC